MAAVAPDENVENVFRLVVTLLALATFAIAWLAYRRQRTTRTLLLMLAFGIYAAKGILFTADLLLGGEVPLIEYVGLAGDAAFLLLVLTAFLKA